MGFSPEYTLKSQNGSDTRVGGALGMSKNGKYIVAAITDKGLARIDTETFDLKMFSNYYLSQYSGAELMLGVSDDGNVVVRSGKNVETSIYTLSQSCGTSNIDTINGANSCSSIPIRPHIAAAAGYDANDPLENKTVSEAIFENPLKFEVSVNGADGEKKFITVNPIGYTEPRLEYLALGDSISSGEGDTTLNSATNQKYYREYTDVEEDAPLAIPREKCHLSTRSYPYWVAGWMQLSSVSGFKQWDSVACSGAKSADIESVLQPYEGQAKGGLDLPIIGDARVPRLWSFPNKSTLQESALSNFRPGRIEQIKFVEKYKPKVITVTLGANDIGFADKLSSCVMPGILGTPYTCDWATSQKLMLGQQIQRQYGSLVATYQNLYKKSGDQAKIYVLGYPKLINNAHDAPCQLNIGDLDAEERQMIDEATSYLNTVTEAAARRAGVKFIDMSDALSGGRLCDEVQAYMTGTAFMGKSEKQESFHPNQYGHVRMSLAFREALGAGYTPLTYDVCPGTTQNICPDMTSAADEPPLPAEFGGSGVRSENIDLMPSAVQKNQQIAMNVSKYSLEPGSTASRVLHSDPIDLGEVTVATDGSIGTTVTIPSTVPAGYHTMVVTGTTYSGEPIELTQTVLVIGNNSNDLDENNTPDTQQPCGPFMASSGQDADLDGVDDACDPEIGEPQLYRVRVGDPERMYGLQPEHEDYLYVERNTRASSITGITGDYDPDGDGWAIVGASQGTSYTTSSVPDTAPAANFAVIGEGISARPYIYIRAGGYGCTSFTPVSLAEVQDGQVRTIKRVAYNTDKCRQEAPNYDIDGNGQPDNMQPLYTARNGDPDKGEDSARIYLYRNLHAAEAQLGISDYTPTGTPAGNPDQSIQDWNLLASSKPGVYIPTFNKLVMLESNAPDNPVNTPLPVILTKKQNGQCIAYRPDTTDIIKMTTQNSRYLVKMANVPEGVGCE